MALWLKTPIPLLILAGAALWLLCARIQKQAFAVLVPWCAIAVYLLFAITSKVDIGIRHTLSIFPLLAVGIASQWPAVSRRWQPVAWGLAVWLGIEALLAYPLYIQYFNEFAGGSENGYRHLIDSNFDWGQDANRLKKFLDDRGISHIYLDYFGTQYNIEYLKIPNTRVNADQARQIKDGWLVVSASELMRPEWAWLRESRQPTARVAETLFVYQVNGQAIPAQ
jgi:hypothetical protein